MFIKSRCEVTLSVLYIYTLSHIEHSSNLRIISSENESLCCVTVCLFFVGKRRDEIVILSDMYVYIVNGEL